MAADYKTVRRGMISDKSLPDGGIGVYRTVRFWHRHAEQGPAAAIGNGLQPGRIGLGEKNVEIFKKLSPADQVAYNRALLGENPQDATFASRWKRKIFRAVAAAR